MFYYNFRYYHLSLLYNDHLGKSSITELKGRNVSTVLHSPQDMATAAWQKQATSGAGKSDKTHITSPPTALSTTGEMSPSSGHKLNCKPKINECHGTLFRVNKSKCSHYKKEINNTMRLVIWNVLSTLILLIGLLLKCIYYQHIPQSDRK